MIPNDDAMTDVAVADEVTEAQDKAAKATKAAPAKATAKS